MREILFKAKSRRDGGWVEGYYAQLGIDDHIEHYIIQNMALTKLFDDWEKNMQFMDVEIILETLCQYTGMKDDSGNRIFENDILLIDELGMDYHAERGKVYYDTQYLGYAVEFVEGETDTYPLSEYNTGDGVEVIGNIFDNPELLEVEE